MDKEAMETRNQLTSVFNQLQRCHTAFADFYPHRGLLKIGGSKVLLPTRLMHVLQECTLEMQHAISGLDESTPQSRSQKRRLVALWTELGELLLRLLKFGRERDTAEVNEAARLPYLASGLIPVLVCNCTILRCGSVYLFDKPGV